MRIAVLTISDAGARGERADTSGDAAAEWAGDRLVARALVPDETLPIVQRLIDWCDYDKADLVITTGGTGLAPRDVTPEATLAVIERNASGIAERIRVATGVGFPRAALGRGVCGIRARTLIINLPGSTIGGTGTETLFGNFGGTNSNGVWSLYVRDDTLTEGGVVGNIAGGWGIEFLGTTAANASIAGRVTTADGRPIRNAEVVITGNALEHPITVSTGSLGWFTFDGLPTGETYVVTVNSRRFTFSTPSRVITLVDNVANADFVANPQ